MHWESNKTAFLCLVTWLRSQLSCAVVVMCVRGVGDSAPVSVSGLLHSGGGLGTLGTCMFSVVDGPVGCGRRETRGRL